MSQPNHEGSYNRQAPTAEDQRYYESEYVNHLANYMPQVQERVRLHDRTMLSTIAKDIIGQISELPADRIIAEDPRTGEVTWGPGATFDRYAGLALKRHQDLQEVIKHDPYLDQVYTRIPEADMAWKGSVIRDFPRHVRNAVMLKLDKDCMSGDLLKDPVKMSKLITRMPVSDAEARELTEKWLYTTLQAADRLKDHEQRDEIIARYSAVYAALCNARPDGSDRPALATTGPKDVTFMHSKAAILKYLQQEAEKSQNEAGADLIEEIGTFLYQGQASLRDMRQQAENQPDELAVRRMARERFSESPTFKAMTDLVRDPKKSVTSAAAVSIAAGMIFTPGAAAATTPESPAKTTVSQAVIDKLNSALGLSPNSVIVVNKPSADVLAAMDKPAVAQANAPGMAVGGAHADAAVLNRLSETPVRADANVKQPDLQKAAPVAGEAGKPLTREERLTRLAGSLGRDAATAQLLNETDKTVPGLDKTNPELNAELTKSVKVFDDKLEAAKLSVDDSIDTIVLLSQLEAAMENPAILDELDDEVKKQLLDASDEKYALVFQGRAATVFAAYQNERFGNWKGMTTEQQKLVSGLVAHLDLRLMDATELNALIEAATPKPAVPPADAAPKPPTAEKPPVVEKAPSAPNTINEQIAYWQKATNMAADKYKWSNNKRWTILALVSECFKNGGNMATVAGMAGPIFGESGYDPNAVEKGYPREGLGLFQHSFGRKASYIKAAKRAGLDPTKESKALIEFTVKFAVAESKKRSQRDNRKLNEWAGMIKITNAKAAAAFWNWNFERPNEKLSSGPKLTEAYNVATQIVTQETKLRPAAPKKPEVQPPKGKSPEATTPIYDGPTRRWNGIVWGNPLRNEDMKHAQYTARYDGYSDDFHERNPHVVGHDGLDIILDKDYKPSEGTPMLALADGVVVRAGKYSKNDSAIQVVVIYHGIGADGKKVYSNIQHVQPDIKVKVGQTVKRGQHIADMGRTGTKGTHGHITIVDNDFDSNYGTPEDGTVGVTDPKFKQKTANPEGVIPGIEAARKYVPPKAAATQKAAPTASKPAVQQTDNKPVAAEPQKDTTPSNSGQTPADSQPQQTKPSESVSDQPKERSNNGQTPAERGGSDDNQGRRQDLA